MRVIDQEGKQLGVIARDEALSKAREVELDLVEIAPNAQPPVAKIIDFKKFLYLEERKQKEARKHTKETDLKEIRVSPFIGDHDLEVSLNRARKFLSEGDLVKVSVVFRGRQMTHTEFGPKLFERIKLALGSQAEQEREPRMEGKRYVGVLKPGKGNVKQETVNEKQETGNSENQTDDKSL